MHMRDRYQCIETNYERHRRKALEEVRGLEGFARLEKIRDHFHKVGHPHAEFTFNQVLMNSRFRVFQRRLGVELMNEMAYLVATNDSLH